MSVALATTAQACVRILVNEVWGDTREITLWDQDQVSDLRLPFKETTGNDDIWQGSGYTVTINKQSTGGSVSYPNGHCKSAVLSLRPRRGNAYFSGFYFDEPYSLLEG